MNEKKPLPVLQKIYELRKAKGIPLSKLSKAFGVKSNAGASLIENGSVPLRVDRLYDVAKVLDVPVWQLLLEESAPLDSELGPLNEDEKALILKFRKVPTISKKKAVLQMVEAITD